MDSSGFFLGTHEVSWLGRVDVPLFVSRRRLARMKRWPRAQAPWALDSGGFTELSTYGRWSLTASEYAAEVRRYSAAIGGLKWAAPQDWMCEATVLAQTGLSVARHQALTVRSLIELRSLAPEIAWVPVLQGQTLADYLRCWAFYEAAGIPLVDEPLVAVGSVCRRQRNSEGEEIFRGLTPLRLHGFGVKTSGIKRFSDSIVSADSMAWSKMAVKQRIKACASTRHSVCSSCIAWALMWRSHVLNAIQGRQVEQAPREPPCE